MKLAYGKKWYTPMEIAKQGLIVNSKGDRSTVSGNYNYVLELIKSSRLRAKNYSRGKQRQNWLVPEDEIARYHDTVSKVEAPKTNDALIAKHTASNKLKKE